MIKKRSEMQGQAPQTTAAATPPQDSGPTRGPAPTVASTPTPAPQDLSVARNDTTPMTSKHQGTVDVEGDEVTVCYGVDKYSPVQYNSFEHGPFFVKTRVRAGETVADAGARAWNSCLALARGAYPGKSQEYLRNLRDLGIITNK